MTYNVFGGTLNLTQSDAGQANSAVLNPLVEFEAPFRSGEREEKAGTGGTEEMRENTPSPNVHFCYDLEPWVDCSTLHEKQQCRGDRDLPFLSNSSTVV